MLHYNVWGCLFILYPITFVKQNAHIKASYYAEQTVLTWKVLSSVRMVKSVYVPSFLICQKFSACMVENFAVRANEYASEAAMPEI